MSIYFYSTLFDRSACTKVLEAKQISYGLWAKLIQQQMLIPSLHSPKLYVLWLTSNVNSIECSFIWKTRTYPAYPTSN